MRRTKAWRTGGWAVAVVAVGSGLATWGCGGGSGCGCSSGGGYNITLPDISCTTSDLWEIRGLQPEHFQPQPAGGLLAATLRPGGTVPLQVGTRSSGSCETQIAAIQWVSTAPEVAAVAGTSRVADLRALAEGETRVHANVTLRDGQKLVAELHAVPSQGSPVMRVYTVRVVR